MVNGNFSKMLQSSKILCPRMWMLFKTKYSKILEKLFFYRVNFCLDRMHAWSLILGSVYVFHPTDEHFIAENLQKNSAAWKSLCFMYPTRGSYNCHRTIKHRFFCYFLITLKLSTSIRQTFEVLKQAQWWGRFSLRWNRVNYQTIYSVVKSFCIFIA